MLWLQQELQGVVWKLFLIVPEQFRGIFESTIINYLVEYDW